MGRKRKQTDEDDEIPGQGEDESEEISLSPQKARRHIDGDLDDLDEIGHGSESLVSPGLLEDPEENEGDLETVGDEEIIQAKSLDLNAFRGKSEAFEQDAFSEWVKMSQKYKPLTADETRAWLDMAHGSDPDLVEMAEDRLIRHNVLWIVKCLHMRAGSQIMSRSSEIRNDLLALGRWGMLTGIRKFNRTAAGKNGQEASLLTYAKFWINKFAGDALSKEHYGLKSEAALERNKAIKARELLRRKLGQEPTYEQIATVMSNTARASANAKGMGDGATREQLRRLGAIDPAKIKDLLTHAVSTTSIDAPVGGDEDGKASIGDYVGNGDIEELDRISEEERYDAVTARLNLLPDPRRRMYFRLLHGIPGPHGFSTHTLTGAEVAVFSGKNKEQIVKTEEDVRAELWGEEETQERPWIMRAPSVPGSIREDAKKMVDLRKLAASEGIRVDATNEVARTDSPFSRGATLEISARNWSCSSGRGGDLFDWLVQRRGLSANEALLEGLRLTVAIPAGRKSVTVDKVRSRKMEAHR